MKDSSVEDVAYCEGSTVPLEYNRTGELAMECWNLRKTILEQSSETIKLKKSLKSYKNLVKNLQKCIKETETESLLKTKDITLKKQKMLELEKKVHELTTNNSFVTNTFTRNKKAMSGLLKNIDELKNENNLLNQKFISMNTSLKDELTSKESQYSLEIRKINDEKDRYLKEISIQQSYLEETTMRSQQLEIGMKDLKHTIELQNKKYSDTLTKISKEHERAYEQLHNKLENIWSERDQFMKRLIDKENENNQLMSFILMEGLQLPELIPTTQALYDTMNEKYPPGTSTLIPGVPILSSSYSNNNDSNEQQDYSYDEDYDMY